MCRCRCAQVHRSRGAEVQRGMQMSTGALVDAEVHWWMQRSTGALVDAEEQRCTGGFR